MGTVVNERASLIAEMGENQQTIRKMVMDSYQDMLAGKGRDCKGFFDELEGRYKNAKYDVIILPLAEQDILKKASKI